MNYYSEKEIQGKVAKEYCRKSNEGDEKQAFSLEDQRAVNLKLFERYKLTPINPSYDESKSAKRRGRPLFNKMVEEVEAGAYSVIVCWALNRLSRNAVDGAMLIELMDNKKLFSIVTAGKVYFNTSEDKLLLQIEFGLSKKYSDDIWPSVERGMNSKVHRHWWPGMPKQGYLNIQNPELGEPVQIIDPDRFPLLRKAIDEILNGNSPAEVLNKLNNKWGYRTRRTKKLGNLPLATSNFYRILNDPFYYGRLVWNEQESVLHESLPRLMSEDEYWKIQQILGSRGVTRPKTKLQVPYRGLIKCKYCGHRIVIYPKNIKLVSGEVKTHYYCRCSKKPTNRDCPQKNVSLDTIEKQMVETLSSLSIHDKFFQWAIKWIKQEHDDLSDVRQTDLQKNHKQLEEKNKLLDRLLDMRLNGEIDKDVYQIKKLQYEKEIRELSLQEKNIDTQAKDWRILAEKSFNFARFAHENFAIASPESKLEIMRCLGTNFLLEGEKLYVDVEKPFQVFQNNQEYVNAEICGYEPLENGVVTGLNGVSQSLLNTWWARRDLNPHDLAASRF